MRTVGYIRTAELGVTIASTYMTAVTLIQTSIYGKLKPYVVGFLNPILKAYMIDPAYIDIILLGLVVALSFNFWKRGDEAGFGRLFSLNMLMFFPAVIDFSMFNWVNLILPYDPRPKVSVLWAFAVGLLLQATYLFLRYTVRFRLLQDELLGRGAVQGDMDEVSKGQMYYLASLVFGTAAISAVIYYIVPVMVSMVNIDVSGIPYPHIVIGVACILLIASAIVYYLRGERGKEGVKKPRARPLQSKEGAREVSVGDSTQAPV